MPKNNFPIKSVKENKEQVKKDIIENNKPENETALLNNKEVKEENKATNQLPEEENITTLFAQNNTEEIASNIPQQCRLLRCLDQLSGPFRKARPYSPSRFHQPTEDQTFPDSSRNHARLEVEGDHEN